MDFEQMPEYASPQMVGHSRQSVPARVRGTVFKNVTRMNVESPVCKNRRPVLLRSQFIRSRSECRPSRRQQERSSPGQWDETAYFSGLSSCW